MSNRLKSINKRVKRLGKYGGCDGKGIYEVYDKGDYKVLDGIKMSNRKYEDYIDKHKDCCLFIQIFFEFNPYKSRREYL
jgi:hypothetical protein